MAALVLRAAGRDDDAEPWARKGLAEHPSGPQTDRLRDQLVDLQLDGGSGADAVAVRREIYERRTVHQEYLKLRQAASRQASGPISAAGPSTRSAAGRTPPQRYARALISVLVGEDPLDEAWAKKIGVSLRQDLYDWAAREVEEGRAESVSALIAEGLELLESRAQLQAGLDLVLVHV